MKIIWTEAALQHIRTRSSRYPGAMNIEPEWTEEAVNDPIAVWFEPDPQA